ncbi:MAG TPA: transposase [Gammaproteobacteria bacterium]
MPRKPRFSLAGVPQHVIQRGNNREPCFYSKEDYLAYLEFMDIAAKKAECHVHAYVLMTNHVHLLLTPMKEYGVSVFMQSLGKRYVQYINSTYKRTGTLWEGRYKASLVDSQAYLLICMRYIELNPVRANMVDTAGEYRWSSYNCNAFAKINNHITPHPLYKALGITVDERCYAYRELFRNKIADRFLHEIREITNHELVLGREDFKDRIEMMLQRKTRKGVPGRPSVREKEICYGVYVY